MTVSGISITGADAGNYTLTVTTAATTANITARALTVTATGVNKVYDGNTTATVTLTRQPRLRATCSRTATRRATFDNKNVGTGKPVSVERHLDQRHRRRQLHRQHDRGDDGGHHGAGR